MRDDGGLVGSHGRTRRQPGPGPGGLAGLLRVGLDLAAGPLRDVDQPLDTAALLAVSRVVTLLGTAHVGTTGQLP